MIQTSRCRTLLLSSVVGLMVSAAGVEAWPGRLQRWGVEGIEPGQLDDLRAIAVDGDGNVYLVDRNRYQKFTNDGTFLFRVNRGLAGSFDTPTGIAVEANGRVLLVEPLSDRIQLFDREGTALQVWGKLYNGVDLPSPWSPVAGDQTFILSAGHVVQLSAEGGVVVRWPLGESMYNLAQGPDGNLYEGRDGWFLKYNPEGALLGALGDEKKMSNVAAFTVDSNGYFFTAWGGTINVYDETGRFRLSWSQHLEIRGMTCDQRGNLYVADAGDHTVTVYKALSPFPDIEKKSAAVMLHIAPPVEPPLACTQVPSSIADIVTKAEARRDGTARYFVYLLGSPEEELNSPEETVFGLAGLQLGIEYKERKNADEGLQILDWTSCSDLEWPQDTWPGSGSGNTITWAAPYHCEKGSIVVAGYFYVSAYSPAFLNLTGYPLTGLVKTANCAAEEGIPDRAIGLDRVGWVSVGEGALGSDTDGCNPLLEPCLRGTVPVEPTTWGSLKSKFVSTQD